jgi:hypothetical protein
MRSDSVVLPESMWAEIPMLRTFSMDDMYFLTCSLLGRPTSGQRIFFLLKARQFSRQQR